MATKEDNKWHMYFVYAVVLAIFGMVIYLVVVNQQIEDQYYLTISFVSDDSASPNAPPTYPTGDDGNLYGGMRAVRDALVAKVDSLSDVNIDIPGLGAWSFNAVAQFKSTTDVDYVYSYTFPAPREIFEKESALEKLISSEYNVTEFFDQASQEIRDWSTTVFAAGTEVRGSLTYGSRDSVAGAVTFAA